MSERKGFSRSSIVKEFLRAKRRGEKIVLLTAYDAITASICQEVGVDALLVGDSVANTYLGMEDTLRVTLDEIEIFTKAVRRGAPQLPIIADMPLMTYETSVRDALLNAHRLVLAGADAVKLEGLWEDQIRALVRAGIPVMGHLGLNPQRGLISGYRRFGRKEEEARKLLEEAKRMEDLGVFSLILEMVNEDTAQRVAEELSIPVIGIGSGKPLDGQVRVITDILGLSPWIPSFAERMLDGRHLFKEAISKFIGEVKGLNF